MKLLFDHEKLQVYQEAIAFVSWTDAVLQKIAKTLAVAGQLDRASTSIPLNIAEGNVSMLVGLIRSNSSNRLHEDMACYVTEGEKD